MFIAIEITSQALEEKGYLDGIYVESFRILIDLFIIGIVITWLLCRNQRKQLIQRYLDEIDDFRGWDSDEACHRIRGSIFRLNKLNISNMDLRECFLSKAQDQD